MSPTAEELRFQLLEEERVTQEAIAACMIRNGFSYVALDPRLTRSISPLPVYRATPGTSDWTTLYGLGVTTLLFDQSLLPDDLVGFEFQEEDLSSLVDPNLRTYEALSQEEQQAWDSQLEKCVADARIADAEARGLGQRISLTPSDDAAAREEVVRSDPRIVAIYTDLANCLRSEGYELDDSQRPEQFLARRYAGLFETASLPNPLTESTIEEIRQAQHYEMEFVQALLRCEYFTVVQEKIAMIVAEIER